MDRLEYTLAQMNEYIIQIQNTTVQMIQTAKKQVLIQVQSLFATKQDLNNILRTSNINKVKAQNTGTMHTIEKELMESQIKRLEFLVQQQKQARQYEQKKMQKKMKQLIEDTKKQIQSTARIAVSKQFAEQRIMSLKNNSIRDSLNHNTSLNTSLNTPLNTSYNMKGSQPRIKQINQTEFNRFKKKIGTLQAKIQDQNQLKNYQKSSNIIQIETDEEDTQITRKNKEKLFNGNHRQQQISKSKKKKTKITDQMKQTMAEYHRKYMENRDKQQLKKNIDDLGIKWSYFLSSKKPANKPHLNTDNQKCVDENKDRKYRYYQADVRQPLHNRK